MHSYMGIFMVIDHAISVSAHVIKNSNFAILRGRPVAMDIYTRRLFLAGSRYGEMYVQLNLLYPIDVEMCDHFIDGG